MKPSSIKTALITAINANRPAFLWGAPGVGKSDIVRQVAEATSRHIADIRAVLLDPVDLRGLPSIQNGRAHWCPPAFLPTEGSGILFLDELNAAPPSVQAACYQLVLDRKLGEYQVPPGWWIVAAGNNETDRAVTNRMPSALRNRFVHLNFEADLDDWVAWALQAGIMTEVIAFLRYKPGLLHDFDPKRDDKAFPSPRSWHFASDILQALPDASTEFELLKGTLGEGAAAELYGFLRIFRDLPNPDAILLNPESAVVPKDPATLYALTGALARKASEQTMERLVTYAGRLPAEFSVMLIRDCQAQNPQVANTRAYIQWTSDHKDVLI
jgi:MoxR-like ATPase